MDKKKAIIISGVTGMDGSWMVEYLLKNTDLMIYGGARRLSTKNHHNIERIKSDRFQLLDFDLTDSHCITKVIKQLQPSYFINFAAQSFVGSSWDFPRQTFETNATAVLDILEAIRLECPNCRFYNAGTSEEFGDVVFSPQNETHPLRPRSPYGASKAASRHLVKVYRESYDLYAIQGWLFNHEGTRRGEEFVTRKITKGVADIYHSMFITGEKPITLELGNVDAKRDWSDAEDFIDGIWRMLNQEHYNVNFPVSACADIKLSRQRFVRSLKEYVLSSNEEHTIREFVEFAFNLIGFPGVWKGEGLDEKFVYGHLELVKINPKFYRPAEVENLFGDSTLARNELCWSPKSTFVDLVHKMVSHDIYLKSGVTL